MSIISAQPTTNTITEKNKLLAIWQQWFFSLDRGTRELGDAGTTAQRPTKNLYVGRQYFDTTLGLPVFVKSLGPPVVWVNGAGVAV